MHGPPLPDAELTAALEDLKANDPARAMLALTRLSLVAPTAARRKEVAAAIETVLSRHDFLTRMVAVFRLCGVRENTCRPCSPCCMTITSPCVRRA